MEDQQTTLTEEEILKAEKERMAAIAKKHNVQKVFEIHCNVDDETNETTNAIFKYPARQVLSSAMAIQERNPLMAKEIILRACFLEGDKRLLDDDYIFGNACTVLDELIGHRMAVLKKN